MATLEDVARRAGVSSMTVSRHINNSGYVSEKTRKKIDAAIGELNFRANLVARSLVTGASMTLGLIIASITDPFYPDLVLGVEDEAYAQGYNVILCNADGKKRENEYIEWLHDRCVDGILFAHLNIDAGQLQAMDRMGIACVLIDNEIDVLATSYVTTDDVLGGYLATEHLIGLGHMRIAMIRGRLGPAASGKTIRYPESFQFRIWNNRTRGYSNALRRHSIMVDPKLIIGAEALCANGEADLGCQAMKRLLQLDAPPTAVYAQSDLMAIGAMQALQQGGRVVGSDVSVVGHDGISIGDMLCPRLTTVAQPRYEIGRAATGMLLERIRHEGFRTLQLQPHLQLKGTTAPPRI